MAFNGTEGEFITLEEAITLSSNYKSRNQGGVYAHFFGAEKLQALLDQEGAVGIRIYLGHDNNGVSKLVLFAADADECNMEGLILDVGSPCPPHCSPTGKP